jgi:hypothetical protein
MARKGLPADPALQVQKNAPREMAKLQVLERNTWVESFVSLGDQVEDW